MAGPPAYVPHYRMLLAGLGIEAISPDGTTVAVDRAFLEQLVDAFARLLPFDPGFYQNAHPDVAEGVRRGHIENLHEHFVRFGFREGRLPHPVPFDPGWYALQDDAMRGLPPKALIASFLQSGRHEGRAGHPDAASLARPWLHAARRKHAGFAHRSIEHAAVHAFMHPLVGPAGRGFRGGLVLGEDRADLPLRHCRGGVPVDSFPAVAAPLELLDGEYVYAGPYCTPFGHAMAEMIHRVLPARALFDCRRLLFVGVAGAQPAVTGFAGLPSAMQAALQVLDVKPADVTVLHEHRLIRRLHVAQQGSDLSGGPTEAYLRLLADFTPARLARLAAPQKEPAARIYVSRSRVAHGGLLLGEVHLERLLAKDGWCVLHPQELPLVAQMQAYRHAETVMFAEGSACHGVELFGLHGIGHCLLLPRRTASRHVFDATLRPRARRYDVLPESTLLGSAVADPDTGAPLDTLGVSLFDLHAIADALRGLGLARLKRLDRRAFARIARTDLADYIGYHRELRTPMVDDGALAALTERCARALRTGPPRR